MTAFTLSCFCVHRCAAVGAVKFLATERIGGDKNCDPEPAKRKLS